VQPEPLPQRRLAALVVARAEVRDLDVALGDPHPRVELSARVKAPTASACIPLLK
jgi:hypothetical protein